MQSSCGGRDYCIWTDHAANSFQTRSCRALLLLPRGFSALSCTPIDHCRLAVEPSVCLRAYCFIPPRLLVASVWACPAVVDTRPQLRDLNVSFCQNLLWSSQPPRVHFSISSNSLRVLGFSPTFLSFLVLYCSFRHWHSGRRHV